MFIGIFARKNIYNVRRTESNLRRSAKNMNFIRIPKQSPKDVGNLIPKKLLLETWKQLYVRKNSNQFTPKT